MLTKLSDSIKRKNAEFIRDVEYIKETAYEDMLDERMESFMGLQKLTPIRGRKPVCDFL